MEGAHRANQWPQSTLSHDHMIQTEDQEPMGRSASVRLLDRAASSGLSAAAQVTAEGEGMHDVGLVEVYECPGSNYASLESKEEADVREKRPDFGCIFPMPGADDDHRMHGAVCADALVTIPVLMVEYVDKSYLTDNATVSLRLVDDNKKIGLQSWPFRAISVNEIRNDVSSDRVCMSNLLIQGLHRIRQDLCVIGSTLFDPGVWTKSELHEALANSSWKGRRNKEYTTRELAAVAKNMGCQHPLTKTARVIEVSLERGRSFPKQGSAAIPPDSYVVFSLEGIEVKSGVVIGSCEPIYNEVMRLFVPDSQMRKDELVLARQKFDIVTEEGMRQRHSKEANEGQEELDVDPDLLRLMPADLPLMFPESDIFGGEDDVKVLMDEYDVNQNGYLEWEEFVNLYDDLVPRPTNLDIAVMRVKTEGEDEDVCIGSAYVSLNDLEQAQLNVQSLEDENGKEVIGGDHKISSISFRVRVYNLSSETGISQDPATEAISQLAYSARIQDDLRCIKKMDPQQYPISVMLRQFDPEIAHGPERIFRIFVFDNQVTAITQRHHEIYFYQLHVDQLLQEYKRVILNFFWTSVATKMRDDAYNDYIFDVFIHRAQDSNDPESLQRVTLLSFRFRVLCVLHPV